MTHLKIVSSLSGFLLAILFVAPLAFAQVDVSADEVPPPGGLGKRILDIKRNAQDAAAKLQADTKMELQSATSGGERKDVIKGAIEDRKDIKSDRRASTTAAIGDFKSLIRIHGGAIKNRYRLALLHLNNLLQRIDSRLEKMAESGVDVSSTAALETEANLAVDKAEIDVKAVGDFVESATNTANRAAMRAELQAKMKTADASLKAAHQATLKLVRSLVALAKGTRAGASATTSAETSVQ